MKTKIIVSVSLLIFALFCFRILTDDKKVDKVTFRAIVLDNNEDSLLIEPSGDSDEIRSSDRIVVFIGDCPIIDSEGKAISAGDIYIGSTIEITHDGMILESYPAQLHGCYKIKLLKQVLLPAETGLISGCYTKNA